MISRDMEISPRWVVVFGLTYWAIAGRRAGCLAIAEGGHEPPLSVAASGAALLPRSGAAFADLAPRHRPRASRANSAMVRA